MPIAIKCPNCAASFNLADEMAGKRVKCQKCDDVFVVPAAVDPPAPPSDEAEPKNAVSATPKKKGPPKFTVVDDDEEDDDDQPRKRRRDRSRARRDERPPPKSGMSGTVMALLGVGLFSCLCCGVGGPVSFLLVGNNPPPRPGPPMPPPIAIADGFDKGFPKFNDGIPFKDKKDFAFDKDGPVFDGFKDKNKFDPFKDKKIAAPAITVAFAPDGTYRSDNVLTQVDARNQAGKPHRAYSVQFLAGVSYQIDMTSNEFDSYLYLVDSKNNIVARDDDSGGYPHARIVYKSAQTANYRIEACSFGSGSGQGKFTLTVKRSDAVAKVDPFPKIDPFPKMEPKKNVNQSIVLKSAITGTFAIKELNLPIPFGAPLSATEPCWNKDGTYLYCLQNGTVLNKILQRDLKIESSLTLPQPCHHLAMSAEGLLTIGNNNTELWLIDPATLEIRKKINVPFASWVAASPTASVAVILATLATVDLKAGKLNQLPIAQAPASFNGQRALALSPDGKFLFVQTNDSSFHRVRVVGNQLVHDAVKIPPVKTAFHFTISPDSKLMTILYPGPSTVTAKKLNGTDMYAIDNWNVPVYSVATRMRELAFDRTGGIYVLTDKAETRYYPNPAKQSDVFQPWQASTTVRRIFTPPQGAGALVGAIGPSFWIEPAAK